MKSNYKKLGQFIQDVSVKNKNLNVELLLGVSITKRFIPSIANTIGTDMSKYKIVKRDQFAYGPVTSRNGEKISVALLNEDECIVSTSYTVFEIIDTEQLDPEYLMMWFRRSEFDRYARYMSHGTVRELFGWEEMCDIELPVPTIEKQRETVQEYNIVNDRILLNELLTQKLEDTAQAIYKQWFIDYEFPISKEYAQFLGKPELKGQPYKTSEGEMKFCEKLDVDIPNLWRSAKILEGLELQRGFDLPRQDRVDGSVPIISSNGGTELHNQAKVKAPGVVTGRSGTVGNVFYIEVDFWPLNTTLWVKNFNAFTPIYSYFFLKNQNLKEYSSGSAVPTLNRNDVHDDYCCIPEKEILEEFERIAGELFKLKSRKVKEKKLMVELLEVVNTKMSKA